ncbi:MAG: hypothetical protein KF745_12650 [Phycisphaeraceae bacterium]|nr:hypothetical protein [Phycisphaeraceae bacterium]
MLALACSLSELLNSPINDDWIRFTAISGGLFIAGLWIVGSTIRSIARTRAREQSRREIAAYVAEGSMSAEDAERILYAGSPSWERPGSCRSA